MLDMASGYWQASVAEQDGHKTAICTGKGLFQWHVLWAEQYVFHFLTRQIAPPTKNGHAPPPTESRKSSQSVNPNGVRAG